MTEDRDKMEKVRTSMVWPTLGWRTAEEQNIDRQLGIHDDYMERLPTILTRYGIGLISHRSGLCRHCCGHIVSCRLQIIIITTGRSSHELDCVAFPSICYPQLGKRCVAMSVSVCASVCLSVCPQQLEVLVAVVLSI